MAKPNRLAWLVLIIWAVLGTAAGIGAGDAVAHLTGQGGPSAHAEAEIAGTVVQRALARPLGDVFAVTVESPEAVTAPGPAAALDSLAATLRRMQDVRGVVTPRAAEGPIRVPLVSRDGRSAALLVALDPANTRLDTLVAPVRAALRSALARLPDGQRYRVLVTGRSPLDRDERLLIASDSRRGELRLLPITFVILVLAFGALAAALLPVGIGALGVPVALVVLGLLARVTPVSVVAMTIVTMVGLGVGIDYSLLMVTRFREELARSGDPGTAARRMLATAGRAVITSGATVAIGFAALLFTPLVETRSVGLAGIVVVAVMVLLAVTLLPAALVILGPDVDWPRHLATRLAWYHAPTLWTRWGSAIARRPLRALLAGALVLGAAIGPVFHMRIGLPARGWWPTATEAGQGVGVLERIGLRGVVQPIRIVVEVPPGDRVTSALHLRGLKALSDSLRHDPRVGSVTSLVDLQPGTGLLQYSVLYSDLPSARAEHRDFLDAYLSADARTTVVDAIVADTTSLTTTMELVGRIRALRDQIEDGGVIRGLRGARLLVGGYAAENVDFQRDLLRRFPLLIALVLGSTALMLGLIFRSVLIPLKAVLLNSASVAATFGILVLAFQDGLGARLLGLDGPAAAIFVVVPVSVFAAVFGLSMDYEVFLLARIKEEYEARGDNTAATVHGLAAVASTITSAALIMAVVFGYFAFGRVLLTQFIGLGLGVAVVLDATIVRVLLVPAIMGLAGRWNWWPRRRRVAAVRPEPLRLHVRGEPIGVGARPAGAGARPATTRPPGTLQ
jgi:RND superfamily putative drug exporter